MVSEEEHHHINEEICQIRSQLTVEEIQEMNEARRQRRTQLPEDENQEMNEDRHQRRAQLPEDEIQEMNEEKRQRRAQLPEEEHQHLIEERRQRRANLPEDERLRLHQQEQEGLRNRNERSGDVPVRFAPQNKRELIFKYYGTRGFPNRMDTKFSACVSWLFSMGNTYHMDASILDKMKYYDLKTFYPDALIRTTLCTFVPIAMHYCSRVKHQVCAVAMDVFTYHLCPSIPKQHGISTFKMALMGPSSVIISGQ
jgi:hypothetical protein